MEMVKDIIEYGAKLIPIAGLVIAWLGLDTWRRQIKGTDKYKVASELLTAVYKLREGIGVFRSPFVEFQPTDDKTSSKEMNEFYGYLETMDRRWKEVSEPLTQLSLLSLKAEVHLSKDTKDKVDVLFKLVRELQVTYEQYITVKNPESGFTEPNDFGPEERKILWAKPTGDDFKKRLLDCIEQIEGIATAYI